MHGVSKTALSQDQKEAKRLERQKKLERFVKARDTILKKIANSEYDDEGLKITGAMLAANPDLYVFWNYRKRTISSVLPLDVSTASTVVTSSNPASQDAQTPTSQQYIQNELSLTEECLRDNPKSYGAWYHRQWILQRYYCGSFGTQRASDILKSELRHCNEGLRFDDRNFHCWDHRRFICQLASVPESEELAFSKQKIDENFSNYSAWHYRSSLLPRLFPPAANDAVLRLQESKLEEDLLYVQNAFFTDPEDQSAWFYHWWLFRPAEGRNNGGAILNYFSFTKTNPASVALSFTNPVNVASDSKLQISVDETPVLTSGWSAPDGSSSCYVWANSKISETAGDYFLRNDSTVTVRLDGVPIGQFKICIANDKEMEWSNQSSHLRHQLQPKLSPSFRKALENSTRSCRDLREVEPSSNKWPLLTEVLSMRCLDLLRYKSEILSSLDLLMRADGRKRAYYEDMKSKFIVEAKLLANSNAIPLRELELTNLGLTALPPLRILSSLISLRELTLDYNRLISSAPLGFLVNLVRLSADGNLFTDTKGIDQLLHLEYLSLASNRLGPSLTTALTPLKRCSNLRQLIVNGNLFGQQESAGSIMAFLEKSKDKVVIII